MKVNGATYTYCTITVGNFRLFLVLQWSLGALALFQPLLHQAVMNCFTENILAAESAQWCGEHTVKEAHMPRRVPLVPRGDAVDLTSFAQQSLRTQIQFIVKTDSM